MKSIEKYGFFWNFAKNNWLQRLIIKKKTILNNKTSFIDEGDC